MEEHHRRHAKEGLHVEVNHAYPRNWGLIDDDDLSYFAAIPRRYVGNPFRSLKSLLLHGPSARTDKSSDVQQSLRDCPTWQRWFILVIIQVLWFLEPLAAGIGHALEFVANVWAANGGLLTVLWRLLLDCLSLFRTQQLVIPVKGSVEHKTLTGLIDPRTELYVEKQHETKNEQGETTPDEQQQQKSDGDLSTFPGTDEERRRTGEVLVMASKLAYENRAVVEKVVTDSWRMHFVDFYDCWNEFQKRESTQAFVFMDRPTNARAVVIAWRGTEPFNTYDWSTDIDFSWCKIMGMGRIHMGFMEALGLADRRHMTTFLSMRAKHTRKVTPGASETHSEAVASGEPLSARAWSAASGLSPQVLDTPNRVLAYDDISAEVRQLLRENPEAKLYVTGHSLGGALAALYTGMLHYYQETEFTERLAAVYTFGQPRVGDQMFANYMVEQLAGRDCYYRVVYGNDLVPRVPFDDALFKFKHWGLCFYFNSIFKGKTLQEAPNKNYFVLADVLFGHLTAWWELVSALLLGGTYGPEFQESLASILFRMVGLLIPGLGCHSPVNYVNIMRLGTPWPFVTKLTEEVIDKRQDIRDVEQTFRLYLGNSAADLWKAIRSFVARK